MKSSRYLLVFLLLFAIAGFAGSSLATGPKTVVVTNNTAYTVNAFYASPSDASGWDTTNPNPKINQAARRLMIRS